MERPDFIQEKSRFDFLAQGNHSSVYKLDGHVVKASYRTDRYTSATDMLLFIQTQYDILKIYLGDYAVNTEFVLGTSNNLQQQNVFLIQKFIEGRPIGSLTHEELSTPHIIDFFKQCVNMHQQTGRIPDILGKPTKTNGYLRPNTTENVIITEKDGYPFPNLVDVMFPRTSLKRVRGPIHAKLILEGTKKLLRSLEK